jgi:hypothetical protein
MKYRISKVEYWADSTEKTVNTSLDGPFTLEEAFSKVESMCKEECKRLNSGGGNNFRYQQLGDKYDMAVLLWMGEDYRVVTGYNIIPVPDSSSLVNVDSCDESSLEARVINVSSSEMALNNRYAPKVTSAGLGVNNNRLGGVYYDLVGKKLVYLEYLEGNSTDEDAVIVYSCDVSPIHMVEWQDFVVASHSKLLSVCQHSFCGLAEDLSGFFYFDFIN